MMQSMRIAAAIVGVIVGAGFSSGQESLQYFVAFGWKGLMGVLLATVLFAVVFMRIVQLGSILQTTSHLEVLRCICGKYLSIVVDWVITFFLFGVLVLMMAGSGALFAQQFGLPSILGNIFMAIITIFTVCLNLKKIVSIMGAFTPIILCVILILGIYAIANIDSSTVGVELAGDLEYAAMSNWVISALVYLSFVTAAGFSMLTVLGGTSNNIKESKVGGMVGGMTIGILTAMLYVALLTNFNNIKDADMPTLILANNLSPWFALFMAIIILGMIYNTAIGMLYAFMVRFIKADHPKFKKMTVGVGIVAFALSFVGFTELVGLLFPITGILGFILIGGILWSFIKRPEKVMKNVGNKDKAVI